MTGKDTAVSLMRMALALLDRDGLEVAACHLEQAIYEADNVVMALVEGPDTTVTYVGPSPGS
jgi:hypothetical protein